MRLYEELETGIECERLAPTLHALAQGTASGDALLELRPHLRNCAGCRATVRALHASRLHRLTAFAPIAALLEPARVWVARLRGGGAARGAEAPPVGELHPMEHQQDVEELMRRLNSGEPVVQPAAPSVVAESAGRLSTVRINLRGWLEPALQRLQSSDLAMGVHAATTGGGGRITSIAALIGICVSGVGAGTYCVATALLPDPKPAIRSQAKTAPQPRRVRGRGPSRVATRSQNQRARLLTVAQRNPSPRSESAPRSARTRASARKPIRRDEFSFETGSSAGETEARPASAATSTSTSASGGGFETANPTQSSTAPTEFSDGGGGEFSP